MLRRRLALLLAVLCGCLVGLALAPAVPAQEDGGSDEAEYRRLERRYFETLSRNPRPGTAFDLWIRNALEAGRLAELEAEAEERAQAQSEDATAQRIFALLLERQGRLDEAVERFRRAGELELEDPIAPYLEGLARARQHDYEAAAEALQRALDRRPPEVDAHAIAHELGRLFIRLGQVDRALEVWSSLLERSGNDRYLLEEIAELLTREQQYDQALLRWEQLRASNPDDAFLRFRCEIEISMVLESQRRPQAAVRRLQELLHEVDPESWQAERLRARIEELFLASDDADGLLESLRAQLDRHPGDLATRLQLADLLQRLGREDEALQAYRDALRRAPSHRGLRQSLIDSLVRASRLDEAVGAARELVELFPDDESTLFQLARLVHRRSTAEDGVDEVLELLDRAVALRPDDARLPLTTAEQALEAHRAWRMRQQVWERSGEDAPTTRPFAAATQRYLEEAIRRAPDQPDAYAELGAFLHAEGRREEAVVAWQRLAAAPRDTAENFQRCAELLGEAGHVEEAIAAGLQACERDPQSYRHAESLVRRLLDAGRAESAMERMEPLEALAEEPSTLQRCLRLRLEAVALLESRADEILRLLARTEGPEATTRDLWLLSLLYRDADRSDEALATARRAHASAPDNIPVGTMTAEMLEATDRLREASDLYLALSERVPQSAMGFLERVALLELRLGEHQRAREVCELLLQRAPDRPELWQLRADLAFSADDVDDGLQVLRRAVRHLPRELGLRALLATQLLDHAEGRGIELARESIEHLWHCVMECEEHRERAAHAARLATAAAVAGESEPVLDRLRRAMQREERGWSVALCLAAAYEAVGRGPDAALMLERALPQIPDEAELLRDGVSACLGGSHLRLAAAYQERLVALTPSKEELRRLAGLYSRSDQGERSQRVWARLLREAQDAEGFAAEVDSRVQEGRFAEARDLARAGLEILPQSWRFLYRAALLHFALNERDEVGPMLQRLTRASPPGGIQPLHQPPSRANPTTSGAGGPNAPFLTYRQIRLLGAVQSVVFVTDGRSVSYKDGSIALKRLPGGSSLDPLLGNARNLGLFSSLRFDSESAFAWPPLPIFQHIHGLEGRSRELQNQLRSLVLEAQRQRAGRRLVAPWDGLDFGDVLTNSFVILAMEGWVPEEPAELGQLRGTVLAELACGRPQRAVELALELHRRDPADPIPHALALLDLDARLHDPESARFELDPARVDLAFQVLLELYPRHAERLRYAYALRSIPLMPTAIPVRCFHELATSRAGFPQLLDLVPHAASVGRVDLCLELLQVLEESAERHAVSSDERFVWLLSILQHGDARHLGTALRLFLESLRENPSEVPPGALPESYVHVRRARESYDFVRFQWPSPTGPLDERHCVLADLLVQAFAQAGRRAELIDHLSTELDRGEDPALRMVHWIARLDAEPASVLAEMKAAVDDAPLDLALTRSLVYASMHAGRTREARALLDRHAARGVDEDWSRVALYDLRCLAVGGDARLALEGLLSELELEHGAPELGPYLPQWRSVVQDEPEDDTHWIFHSLGTLTPELKLPPSSRTELPILLEFARDEGRLDALLQAARRSEARFEGRADLLALIALAELHRGDGPEARQAVIDWQQSVGAELGDSESAANTWIVVRALARPELRDLVRDQARQLFYDALMARDQSGQFDLYQAAVSAEVGADEQPLFDALMDPAWSRYLEENRVVLRTGQDAVMSKMKQMAQWTLTADPRLRTNCLRHLFGRLRRQAEQDADNRVARQILPDLLGRLRELDEETRRLCIEQTEALLFAEGAEQAPMLSDWRRSRIGSHRFRLLDAFLELVRRDGSLSTLRAGWDAHPRAEGPDLLIARSAAAWYDDDVEASAALARAAEATASFSDPYLEGRALAASRNHPAALAAFEEALGLAVDERTRSLILGEMARSRTRARDIPGAATCLRRMPPRALHRLPALEVFPLLLAAEEDGGFVRSIELIRARPARPEDADEAALRAAALFREAEFEQALARFEAVAALRGSFDAPFDRLWRALCLARLDRYEDASELLKTDLLWADLPPPLQAPVLQELSAALADDDRP